MTRWSDAPPIDREVIVDVTDAGLAGRLVLPAGAIGLVLFAHGSGSSRLSPRNVQVAECLHAARMGTLLFDLLTESESRIRARIFDIPRLAQRLADATRWSMRQPEAGGLRIGYFGASTGAAAALFAASQLREAIAAVVSRGGRPDLAMPALPSVVAPTLLIVGSLDEDVLQLNRLALGRLAGERRLEVVAGASHLFEEAGTLERVAELATDWFAAHFAEIAVRPRS